jgi:hypothetical protein
MRPINMTCTHCLNPRWVIPDESGLVVAHCPGCGRLLTPTPQSRPADED